MTHQPVRYQRTLRILSAGAAQAVTERLIQDFRRDTGSDVAAEFSAVGAMKGRITGGEAVDVIILTRAMIDELERAALVAAGSQLDLGRVGTGVAVRAGAPVPNVASAAGLRAAVRGAAKLVCPDPAVATAGKVVLAALDRLGIADEVRGRMQYFANGYAAMGWLAAEGDVRDLGITQVTEILPNKGVTYAGPLPDELQMKTVYSAGVAARALEPQLARDFVARFGLPSGQAALLEAGYELS